MGLDTSHDAWHGPCGAFNRWRRRLAGLIGIPLDLMWGHAFLWSGLSNYPDYPTRQSVEHELAAVPYGKTRAWLEYADAAMRQTPHMMIHWHGDDPLFKVLHHSDCDGRIRWWDAGQIAIRLGQLLRSPDFPKRSAADPDCFYEKTLRFAAGCARAFKAREDLVFR